MKLKFYLTLTLAAFFSSFIYSQEVNHPLYNLTIIKSLNNENKRTDKFIEINSLGIIYSQNKKTGKSLDIKKFTEEVNKYVVEEKVDKYPGSNDILFLEAPTPKLNKQTIIISIKFLDDLNREKELRNKTYYSWGKPFDKNVNDYPFFKYLSESEVEIFKALLE